MGLTVRSTGSLPKLACVPAKLCGLRCRDIHEGFVQVERSVWRGKAGTPKWEKTRTFAISERLQAKLASMHDGSADLSRLIFTTRNGTPWNADMVVKRKLHPLLGRLGIQRAGLHAFRHGNETMLDRMKAPVAVRLSRLGHSDTRMMMNYSHVVSETTALSRKRSRKNLWRSVAKKCGENEKGLPDRIQ